MKFKQKYFIYHQMFNFKGKLSTMKYDSTISTVTQNQGLENENRIHVENVLVSNQEILHSIDTHFEICKVIRTIN